MAKEHQARDISENLMPPPELMSASYGEFHLNENTDTLVSVDGEEILIPNGFTKILVQPRRCGDFYAELVGKRGFSAFDENRANAVNLVAQKALRA